MASYDMQAGVQPYGYAQFFMNGAALHYLNRNEAWEIGIGLSIVVVDACVAKTLTTTTAKNNV